MNLLILAALGLTSAFIGFAIGRFGDKWGGHLNGLHHWIYGLALIILGAIYRNNYLGIISLFFGAGHFVSDLDDFLHRRIWGVDVPHKWKFWSIK